MADLPPRETWYYLNKIDLLLFSRFKWRKIAQGSLTTTTDVKL